MIIIRVDPNPAELDKSLNENNTMNSEEIENSVFLKDVSVEVFSSTEDAILWLKKFGPVE